VNAYWWADARCGASGAHGFVLLTLPPLAPEPFIHKQVLFVATPRSQLRKERSALVC
jgi:hypothetical protein